MPRRAGFRLRVRNRLESSGVSNEQSNALYDALPSDLQNDLQAGRVGPQTVAGVTKANNELGKPLKDEANFKLMLKLWQAVVIANRINAEWEKRVDP